MVLADELTHLKVACAAVLGNHDYDAGAHEQIVRILRQAGVHVLDGDHFIFNRHLGIAGVKGFGGGFGNATLQAFGERLTKDYVHESVTESLKLESALGQLDTRIKVVLMHYSPVPSTTVGENLEVRPFLGSSRLMGPIDRYGADAVFHGHCHHGALRGTTEKGVPVYNVALPRIRQENPEQRFVVVELSLLEAPGMS